MVAKITVPISIKRALNYNEQKMKQGVANCIYAHSFLKEAEQLNFYEKLRRFERLIVLNKRASTNTVHISLNFGLNEKLEKEKLIEIATVYMKKIGFDQQPYLVYEHHDSGHPHVHIVTTNIQKDGKRISLHNLGKNESANARKKIEIEYNLVKAEDQAKHTNEIAPLYAQKIIYGKSATKRAITNVLDKILPIYKYASLPELNAILELYNLSADRGKEDGIIFKNNGLLYRILDQDGNKIGVPIKASSIYNKPTLSYLMKKFAENELLKEQNKKSVKTSIDWVLLKPPMSLQAFKQALQKEKISLVIRQNENGIIYGLTYIDHNIKCVFNGSDIGKEYSAKRILEKLGVVQSASNEKILPNTNTLTDRNQVNTNPNRDEKQGSDLTKLLDAVVSPVEDHSNLPFELRKPKRKKRKS